MTVQYRKSFGSKSLVAVVLMSVVGATLPAAARAEDCLAAPNSPAREGTRWLYRLDRATQHKCWYMGAFGQPTQRAGAAAKIALSALPLTIPLPRPRPLAAKPSLSLSLSSPDPLPESFATTPGPTLPVSGTIEEIPSPSGSDPQQARTSLAGPAPDTNAPISASADEITSAISETHQVVPSPETNVEVIAPTPKAQPPIGTATDKTSPPASELAVRQQAAPASQPNAEMAPRVTNAAPQIVATVDDSSSSIPNDSMTPLNTSSQLNFNAAEPASGVSVAKSHAPITVAMINARPLTPNAPADLTPDGRERTSLSDKFIGIVGIHVPPLYLILAFVVALVGIFYYVVFKYLPGSGARISIDHPADDYVDDDLYNNPEFYRKLRQGGA
jgi:hypothetical protein